MDAKLLCPTLSVVLVKTIKALCEINIKYDTKLEITGSLHVRSDGQKVLTCLLDEETVKGQYDAARVAELAARLSMAAASFPFTHLQMSPNVNHSQQALFSAIPSDVHILGSQQQQAIGLERPIRDGNEPVAMGTQAAVFHQGGKVSDGGGQVVLPDSGIAATNMRLQEETLQPATVFRQLDDERHMGMALKHGDVRTRQNSGESIISQQQQQHSHGRKRHTDSASNMPNITKAGTNNTSAGAITSYVIATQDINSIFTQPSSQNHVKLPDIQTLAHSLPKIPGSRPKTAALSSNLQQALMPIVTKSESIPQFVTTPADSSAISPTSMLSLDSVMGVELESQSEGNADRGSSPRKKFQCMFCGIFLSTKCYLKNHINAMHTRARVYPCELCERYFYSAGALRIHKLRNHWQDSKKHVCVHCNETFLLPIELRKHTVKKHATCDDQQLLMDSVDMKLEDGELSMPQLQPEDVSIASRESLADTTSACYQTVDEIKHPSTSSSSRTPPSLEANGVVME